MKIVEATAESDLPAARAGLAIGPLLARGGDYFGLPVNMASRLVDRADPGTVLVDQSHDASPAWAALVRQPGIARDRRRAAWRLRRQA